MLADPDRDGLLANCARIAAEELIRAGRTVDLLDLHALGFEPAMSTAEWHAYHGAVPILDPMVADHAALISRAEDLVFVYPTPWTGLPAILKGWVDRVLVPGVAFGFHPESGVVQPALTQVRRIVGISTYTAPRWRVRVVNDNGRRVFSRTLWVSCGFGPARRWIPLYRSESSGPAEVEQFRSRVRAEFSSLATTSAPSQDESNLSTRPEP